MTVTVDDPRYPIGPFTAVLPATADIRTAAARDIAEMPARLRAAVAGLTDAQLDTPYRDGGWTVRQVVHHVGDSHMNAYIRFKLALTEDNPTIKPYDENTWARLPDMQLPVEVSLQLIESLHARWIALIDAMTSPEFARTFFHPELGEALPLDRFVQSYGWHSRHHVAHITELRRRQGW